MKNDDGTGEETPPKKKGKKGTDSLEENSPILNLEEMEGAILLREDGVELVIPTMDNPKDPQLVEDIVNIMTYLMYALEREDWKDEFAKVLVDQVEKEESAERLAQIKKKRSHLKVVK
jgi:hypothetical protein